jgi:dTDP-glucose 4,6-dehydratase
LSPDSGLAVRDVVDAIARRMGRRLDEIAESVAERPGQDAAYVIDSTRARTELGWRPQVSFDAGIDEVIQWIDLHWDELRRLPLEYQHRS